MKQGEIKFYNRTKNFGFVKDTEDGKEYFFHSSSLKGDYVPRDGDAVDFEGEMAEKGLRATLVQKAGSAPAAAAPAEEDDEDEDAEEDLDDAA